MWFLSTASSSVSNEQHDGYQAPMFSFLPHKNVPDILKYEGKHPTTLNIAIIDQKYVVCVRLNSLWKSYKNRLRSRMSC